MRKENNLKCKRFFDLLAAVIVLIVLSPALAFLGLLIAIKMGRPVIFKQTRPGLNGKSFNMIKFRTMKDAVDTEGNPLPDSDRITSFGQFLRSASLDELPGLWCVLKGDMSLVGPRPLLV